MVAYALMMGGMALTVLIAGIIGTEIAPAPGWATLPIALVIVGLAAATLPTGRLQLRFGRRTVFLAFGLLAIFSTFLAAWAISHDSFVVYCLSTFTMGFATAAGHQYRFAALELVPAEKAAKATSVLLLGGILGAFVGPEMAVRGRFLLDTEYVGSYMLLATGYALAMCIVMFYRERSIGDEVEQADGRPLGEVLRNPLVVLAIASAVTGYGVMSFLMTATPISMHEHSGHSIEATKWVIQAHIIAMYLPSVFYPALQGWLGYRKMLWLGVAALAMTVVIALGGVALFNYWLALVLLGIGWNFLFLTGTNLLALGYRRSERFQVQSFNDFLTFSVQATVSLASGWFLFRFQWQGLVWAATVPVLAYVVLLLRTASVTRVVTRHSTTN